MRKCRAKKVNNLPKLTHLVGKKKTRTETQVLQIVEYGKQDLVLLSDLSSNLASVIY